MKIYNSPMDWPLVLLMVKKIRRENHLGCRKPCLNSGINHQPQQVRRISEPSTVPFDGTHHVFGVFSIHQFVLQDTDSDNDGTKVFALTCARFLLSQTPMVTIRKN